MERLPLPPIEYFMGFSYMNLFISKCKPFKPKMAEIDWLELPNCDSQLIFKAFMFDEKEVREVESDREFYGISPLEPLIRTVSRLTNPDYFNRISYRRPSSTRVKINKEISEELSKLIKEFDVRITTSREKL